jgi:hypothetical protein
MPVYGSDNCRNCVHGRLLCQAVSTMVISGFYQDFAGFFLVSHRFSARAELYASMRRLPAPVGTRLHSDGGSPQCTPCTL